MSDETSSATCKPPAGKDSLPTDPKAGPTVCNSSSIVKLTSTHVRNTTEVTSEDDLMEVVERTIMKIMQDRAPKPPPSTKPEVDQGADYPYMGEDRPSPADKEKEKQSRPEDDKMWPPMKARFFPAITRDAIFHIESTNPFKDIQLFDIAGIEKEPITFQSVPANYRPYEGCLFDVLNESDDDIRFQNLKEFFLTLAAPGDKGRECGLLYTIMHFWKVIFFLQIPGVRFELSHIVTTLNYLLDAGMIGCYMRILTYCFDKKFLLFEYNRYVPYRILESLFVCSHMEQPKNMTAVEKIIEDEQRAVNIFYPILNGAISAIEQLVCCQLVGNLSSYINGVNWLLRNPKLCAAVGRHLWCSYDTLYTSLQQYEDMRNTYHVNLVYTSVSITTTDRGTPPYPIRVGDLSMYLALCLACNICAAYPDDNPMSEIKPSILAIVKEGLFDHVGDVISGIFLNFERNPDMSPSKFLSFVSWSCFQPASQKIVLEQLNSLPYSRHDNPFYFNRRSFTKTRSVVAFLITHALWFDYEKGSHFSMLGVLRLLIEDDDVAMEVIRLAGDILFDIAHSIHHVRMPEDRNPIAVKQTIFEVMLRLGGIAYFRENAIKMAGLACKFKEPLPQCISNAKDYCDRHATEMNLSKNEKQVLVRGADSFKSEGNNFFVNCQYESAIDCYTKALDTCPLTCIERRVTYHSNRAECYLKINQPRRAISDCNRAIAMNPGTFKARWRRSQALQLINVKHLAGLDLLHICRREDEVAKSILGEKKVKELNHATFTLLDESNFSEISEQLYGQTVYGGHIQRSYGKNIAKAVNTFEIPPYSGKPFHQIFGIGPGDHTQNH